MNFSSNQIGLTQSTVYDISAADLAGANSGQRPDLLAKTQAIYRTPDQKLYAANAARSQLVVASTPVTTETNPLTGGKATGLVLNGEVNSIFQPSSRYLACIPGRQFVTSGVPKDLSNNGCDAVLGSALTDANLWATNGYMTTAVLANGALSLPLAKTAFNLATDSVVFSVLLKKAAPAGNDIIFGNADVASNKGFYLSCRATTGKVRPVLNASAVVSGLSDSNAVFADGADHVLTFAFDAITKQAFLWRDGCLSDVYATGLTGDATPLSSFFLASGPSLAGAAVAAQFSGLHLLKFAGGLPTNVNRIAARLAARPFDYLTDSDVQNA